jgi:hypothetical protein
MVVIAKRRLKMIKRYEPSSILDDAIQKEKLRATSKDYEDLRQGRYQLESMRGFVSNEAAWIRQRHQVGDKIRRMERGLSEGDLQMLAEIAGRPRVAGHELAVISRRLARDGRAVMGAISAAEASMFLLV